MANINRQCQPEPSSLSSLPSEIKIKIAQNLGQIDALNLSRTGKGMLETCLQRIYENLVVDAFYTQFSKEYYRGSTYINLLYNLKRYFRAKRRNTTKVIWVLNLPDLTNVYTPETQELIEEFFSGLHNLHELVWIAENFTLDYLNILPNQHLLERLEVNINITNVVNQTSVFKNLRHLNIRPFNNLDRLKHLLTAILGESGVGKTDLDSLEIARFNSDSPALIPAREISSLGTEAQQNGDLQPFSAELETNTVQVLLTSKFVSRLKHLSVLCLNSVFVSEHDARLLIESLELNQLKKLLLKNVAEYEQGGVGQTNVGFLGAISRHLLKLVHLHLDFREIYRDTVAAFLACLPRVKSLDLVVRMNVLKRRYVDESELYNQYGVAIAGHTALQKLSMEVRQEHSFCEIVIPTPKAMLCGLSALHGLKRLRIPFVDGLARPSLSHILKGLHQLHFLDIYGVNTGGFPNLGLGMVHPNVYDEWFKVQHFAADFWVMQKNIQYIRINECIFECTAGDVQPRDTINRWFNGHIRV